MDTANRFRAANEQIAEKAKVLSFPTKVPFLCECADDACTELLPLDLDEYDRVRAEPAHLVTVPGHPVGESASVVDANDRFSVVAEIAPREA